MGWRELSEAVCAMHNVQGSAILRFDGTPPPDELSVDDFVPEHLVCRGTSISPGALRQAFWDWRKHTSYLGPHGCIWSRYFQDTDTTLVGIGKLIPAESPPPQGN